MGDKKIKIGFLCAVSPQDKKVWSGTISKMHDAFLQNGFDVLWIPIKYSNSELNIFDKISKFYMKVFNRGFNKNHFISKALISSKNIKKALSKVDIDVIFAPTSINEIAFLKTKKPIVYLNDATFHQLINYYGGMSGFGYLSKKHTLFIERKALKNADALVFSSNWAANDARHFYGVPEEKINVVKFGSNSEVPQKINLEKDYSSEIIFLFLAVDWERKGGNIALQTIEILRKKGYNVKLQVVGCVPPIKSDAMDIIPFLNKNIPEEAEKVRDFLRNAHFMFIPTRADCTPISFCEAASYGLPVITTATGGVTDIVENGKTGFALPENAQPEQYAEEIEKLINNPEIIRELSLNARKKYDEELNWEVWGKEMKKIIEHTIS